ncbi:unnamed protein product [Phaeothamnion confervicola]
MTADAMRFLLALAAKFRFEIHQLDVVTAYLKAVLDEELYTCAPPGVAGFEDCLGLKLLKALYGLKQAVYLWHLCLWAWLIEEGFHSNDADCCVFVHGTATMAAAARGNESYLVVGIHVDDLLTTGYPVSAITDFKASASKRFHMKDLGQVHNLLAGGCGVIVTLYVAPVTPAEIATMPTTPYRELVGALLFVAVMTCPDIFNAVRGLTRFCSNPWPWLWRAAQHVLKYLKGQRKRACCTAVTLQLSAAARLVT